MKNILILGANSYVGFYVAQKLSSTNNVIGITRKELPDIFNLEALSIIIKNSKIDIVINCICMGNVDQCEREQDMALKVNYTYVENLVLLSKELKFKLIHFSSNAVYCGDKPTYSEDSVKEPKNFYGKVKALADDYIKNNLNDYLLIRVMTLFGDKQEFHRNNPGAMVLNALLANKPLQLVDDLYGNLLFIDDLVNFIDVAIKNNLSGEFNIAGDDIVNRYELGLLACEVLKKPTSLVTACSSDAFPSLAARANNTSFDNRKAKGLNGVEITPIKEALKIMLERMKHGNN
jgi:dTDP-4-dehydrorhamnose reductase